jgi:hypothetical protein
MSYVYIESEKWTDEDGNKHHLYTVGFYDPNGKFQPDTDHDDKEKAAERVSWLNGGLSPRAVETLYEAAVFYMEKNA